MHSKKARRGAVLLLVLALLAAAAPAAAAPERASIDPAIGSSLFEALAAWLATLVPAPGPAATPAPAWAATGAAAAMEPQPGGHVDAADDPTAEPQIGSDIDPNG